MKKYYFANRVFMVRDFTKYAFYHSDQFGCHVNNRFFLDRKISAFTDDHGDYFDLNKNIAFELETPWVANDIVWCHDCDKFPDMPFERDCDRSPSSEPKFCGIVNIYPLTSLFEGYEPDEALKIIEEYNASLPDDSLVPIDNLRRNKFKNTTRKSASKVRRYLRRNK